MRLTPSEFDEVIGFVIAALTEDEARALATEDGEEEIRRYNRFWHDEAKSVIYCIGSGPGQSRVILKSALYS